MNESVDAVRSYIREHQLIETGDRVLVAFSGGPDSTALACILSEIEGVSAAAAHLNHLTRGAESDCDEQFARSAAQTLGIPIHVRRESVGESISRGESFEEAARRVRYHFFRQVCSDNGYTRIATGHTSDDNAETILFRILRGTGLQGLSGIAPRSGMVIHPLLCLTRRQVTEYLETCGSSWRTDSSNYRLTIPRNRIRHQVLPLLESINKGCADHLLNLADIARESSELVRQRADEKFIELCIESLPERVALDYEKFAELSAGLKKALILRALSGMNFSGVKQSGLSLPCLYEENGSMSTGSTMFFPFTGLERVAGTSGSGNRVLYENRFITVRREYGRLIIQKRVVSDRVPEYLCTVPNGAGSVRIPEACLSINCSVTGPETVFDTSQVHLDYRKASFPIVIRNRRPGDRIVLSGGVSRTSAARKARKPVITKKIKDLFIDHKVPSTVRDRVPLVVIGKEVAAVFCSLYGRDNRVSARFEITTETRQILKLEIESTDCP
jgi:tRNA(Ile)-lysidine synthase